MINNLNLPLVAWENGTWMIAIFALVSLVLILAVVAMMSSGKKKE